MNISTESKRVNMLEDIPIIITVGDTPLAEVRKTIAKYCFWHDHKLITDDDFIQAMLSLAMMADDLDPADR